MGCLDGKRALIVGIASNRSIAYGIAKSMRREGAELAFTYQNEKLKPRVEKFAAEFGSDLVMPCEVTSDDEINRVFDTLGKTWDGLDALVHSVAFAPKELLEGHFLDNVSREGFQSALDVSVYSLIGLAKAAHPMMTGRDSAILTLSYLGAVRALPNYNMMGVAKAALEATIRYLAYSMGPEGIRVNGISAGPIRTLAASGVSDFRKLQKSVAAAAPLGRNVTIEEVGDTAAFLCSDLASGITAEISYVDAGYSTVASGD